MKALLIIIGALIAISLIYGTVRDNGFSFGLSSGGEGRSSSRTNTSKDDSISQILQEYANSPHAGLIELRTARARDKDPEDEYLEIRADRDLLGQVNMTGWRVESLVTGTTFSIPQVALIPPYPNATRRAVLGPVVLEARHELYVVTAKSPVQKNFRSSICTGYLENTLDFTPRLDKSCPDPEDEDLTQFGIDREREEDCLRKIRGVGTCKDPGAVDDDDISRDCREYIRDDINYNTCISLHAGDADFFGSEWYVYMNEVFYDQWGDEIDTIVLFDAQNRVVDVVEYD